MRTRNRRIRRLAALGSVIALSALALAALAPPASAQIGGGLGGGLGRSLSGALGQTLQAPGRLTQQGLDALDPQTLLSQRLDRLDAQVQAHPREIERDDHGAPVVRGEVLALAPSAAALDAARQAGFQVARAADPADLVGLVVLQTPPGMSAREAVKRLRKADPSGAYDFNHIYEPSGEVRSAVGSRSPSAAARLSGVRIGLIDTGVDGSSPTLASARVEQKAFAGEGVRAAPHGTAVASLLVGDRPPFRGAAPGGALLVADIYGGAPAGGGADALVRGLDWLAARNVRVINLSLVGPPNLALAAAVKALQARGVMLVAAVGNDGPAAPPAYPASYAGVVAVTAVDAHGRVLLEAGRAEHLDFAAPGADMAAAAPGGNYVAVRGTSFAAPLVAGRLDALLSESGLSASAALDALAAEGRHQRAYGRGLVAADLRTPPAQVSARAASIK